MAMSPTNPWLRPLLQMLCIVLVVAGLDQLTKLLVLMRLGEGEPLSVVEGFFSLTLTYNRGAAFGLLAGVEDGYRQICLAISTVCALSMVVYFLIHDYPRDPFAQGALALIVGGALGNLIDRFRLGVVVDFVDVFYDSYHWPAFNLADSAICIGVFAIILRRPKTLKLSDDASKAERAL